MNESQSVSGFPPSGVACYLPVFLSDCADGIPSIFGGFLNFLLGSTITKNFLGMGADQATQNLPDPDDEYKYPAAVNALPIDLFTPFY